MKRRILAALALSTAALGLPPAHAAPTYEGGCGLNATTDPSGQVLNPDSFAGVIYAGVAGFDDAAIPAYTAVTCVLQVNGAAVDSAYFAGSPVAVGAEETQFVAPDGSLVEVCEYVSVGGYHLSGSCAATDHVNLPPDEVYDLTSPLWDGLEDPPSVLPTGVGDNTGADPWGSMCAFTSTSLPGTSLQTGEIDIGPAVLDDGNGTAVYSGTVRCSIQVGGTGRHEDVDATSAAASGTAVVVGLPTPVAFDADADDTVHLCAAVELAGGTTLYYDEPAGQWSSSPLARCRVASDTGVPLPRGDTRAAGDDDADAKSARSTRGKKSLRPYYPSGTVEISSSAAGIVNFAYRDFTPALNLWVCRTSATASGTASTCVPPAPPSGYVNTCGVVKAEAQSSTVGTVHGNSACSAGAFASATSTGPATDPTDRTSGSYAAFPWNCTAAPAGAVVWTVRCTVGV